MKAGDQATDMLHGSKTVTLRQWHPPVTVWQKRHSPGGEWRVADADGGEYDVPANELYPVR